MNLRHASVSTSRMSLRANLLFTTLENTLLTMIRTSLITPRSNRVSSTGCQELTLRRSSPHPWPNQTLSRNWCPCDRKFTQELMLSSSWTGHSRSRSQQFRCKSLLQLHPNCKLWLQETWMSSHSQHQLRNRHRSLLRWVGWWACLGLIATDQTLDPRDQLLLAVTRHLIRNHTARMLSEEVCLVKSWDESRTRHQFQSVEARELSLSNKVHKGC